MSSQDAIIQVKRIEKFTVVRNSLLEDENLSWAAKGLHSYLVGRSDNWKIYVSQLSKIYKGKGRGNKRDAVKSCIKELRDQGYITYTKTRNSSGKWVHIYTVHEEKITHFQKIIPATVKPTLVKPTLVKPSILPNTDLPNTDLNPPPPSPPKKPVKPKNPDKLKMEEEDFHIFDCLRGNPDLTIVEMRRLSKLYSEEEVCRALKIASTQEVKKTLMHLLLNILKHPEKWEYREDLKPSPEKLALRYNSMIENQDKEIFKQNIKGIKNGIVWVRLPEGHSQVSLKSYYAEQEIQKAIEYIKETKK